MFWNARAARMVARPMELAHVSDRMLAKIALIALTAVVIVAGGRFLARTPPRGSYYLVDELIASGLRAHEGEEVRVHGFVATGSIERLYGDDALYRFLLVWHGVGLPMQVQSALPDAFRDQAEVIVTGRLLDRDGWRIEGTAVIAKCPGAYVGAQVTPREATFQ